MRPYYEDDLVTLYHGDCREVTAWLDADVLVTDPPYGVRWEASFGGKRADQLARRERRGGTGRERTRDVVSGDNSPEARDAALAAWGSRPAIVFGSWRIERPTSVKHILIWHKAGAFAGVRAHHPFISNHEEVYVIGDGWVSTGKPLYSVMTTTEPRHVATQQIGHPTPKPLGLMESLIERCPEGVIADPFSGSGSTLLAAKALGRRAIGVELDERYCEIAARRLAQDTLFGGVA